MKLCSNVQSGILFSILLFSSCASIPRGSFVTPVSSGPDYADATNWAALPTRFDSADVVPFKEWTDVQGETEVDVFFIHPTTYTKKKGNNQWNASLDNEKLNRRTDASTIRYQASLFNGVGNVYAPRYRQAHIESFYTHKKKDAASALNLAYEDVRNSFNYFLEHFNEGRPFVLAAHSQGTFHAARLIREEIENQPVQQQMIVAYLPGMPVRSNYFESITPCKTPEETGCFCSWRTFRKGHIPKKLHYEDSLIVVTNPVTWNCNDVDSDKNEQVGAVLRDCNQLVPALVETDVHEDLLWVSKPKFPGSFLLVTKNYHIADYNFFYGDVRQNAQARVRAFLSK